MRTLDGINVGLSIIGYKPCGHFTITEWVKKQIDDLPKGHEVKEKYLCFTLDPARHKIITHLFLKSVKETDDDKITIERHKTWEFDYHEVELFYRKLEKENGKNFRDEKK